MAFPKKHLYNDEAIVIDRLRAFLADRGAILDVIGHRSDQKTGCGPLIERGQELVRAIDGQEPETPKSLVRALVRRVEVRPDCARIAVSRERLLALLSSQSTHLLAEDQSQSDAGDTVLTLIAPMRLRRIGREMKLLVDGSEQTARFDTSLLKLLARAHDAQARMNQNTKLGVRDIARADGVTPAYVYILLRLPWLAPDIITAEKAVTACTGETSASSDPRV